MTSTTPWLQSLGHVGHVVEDLAGAMERYTSTFGMAWSPVRRSVLAVRDGAGEVSAVELAIAWSVDHPVHVELFEEAPGSVWTRAMGQPIHHLSYWVADLDTEAARLRAAGYRLEVTKDGERDLNGFAYFVGPDGLRVEPKPESGRAEHELRYQGIHPV